MQSLRCSRKPSRPAPDAGAQVDTRRAALPCFDSRRVAAAIDLVEDERERNLGGHVLQVVFDRGDRLRVRGIDDEQHAVSA